MLVMNRDRWRAAVLGTTDFSTSDGYVIEGQYGRGFLGRVACGGDVNGDGVTHVIVGAGMAGSKVGAAYVVYGYKAGVPFTTEEGDGHQNS